MASTVHETDNWGGVTVHCGVLGASAKLQISSRYKWFPLHDTTTENANILKKQLDSLKIPCRATNHTEIHKK